MGVIIYFYSQTLMIY